MTTPLTHTYRDIGDGVFALEVDGHLKGYISRRQTTARGGSHWSFRRIKFGDWIGQYETRREAREALMRANSMQVYTCQD